MSKHALKMLVLQVGELVRQGRNEYVITKIVELDSVLARNLDSGKSEVIRVWELSPSQVGEEEQKPEPMRELEEVSEADWDYARRCLEIIKPLLGRHKRGNNVADSIAQESGVSRATLYRWLRFYRNTGLLSSLLPTKRKGGRGKGRLSDEIEAIIEDRVQNYYLTDQQPTITDTAAEIRRLCSNAGLPLPHSHTVRKRIEWISERERISRRRGRRIAIERFDPNEGTVPDADWPLAMVQIDHTKVNVIVVHELTRQPIGRAWITLAIDVYSRMIVGMYLTLDAPSAMSAGMCIAHAILPKEHWLEEVGVDNVEWPCWGVMGILHMDNAREFRGDMLKVACNEHGIDLHLRPVKTPHYGGHIERLMGTLSKELTQLPGTTFSNPKERGEYDSEGKAVMTLKELEKWLVLFVAKYHHRIHGGIGMSPLQKYREGLLGGNGRAPRGLPSRRLDDEKVRLDFMPFVERTVQAYGVLIDDIHYFADVLRPWVGAKDLDNPSASRLFRFKRDPRDISQLYFFDPLSERYFAIPYRDASLPPISLEELREARKAAKEAGYKDPDERILFEFTNRQREMVDQAAAKSKAARIKQQKRLNNEKAKTQKARQMPKTTATAKPAEPLVIPGYDPAPNEFFEDDY
jgi:putative transposase